MLLVKNPRYQALKGKISVETFGERIKKISEFSMTDLEEFSISDEFNRRHTLGMMDTKLTRNQVAKEFTATSFIVKMGYKPARGYPFCRT